MTISFRGQLMLATAMLCAPLAIAQDAAPAEEAESRQEAIIVTATPIRDSQAAAILAKREAPNVVDVISADTIGRFPDQNLADSLGRLPGLAIERDQGQARYINFRGAPFRYTSIAFDGIDVPGAENGRIPRFDSFPSVITSRVEANKAITADMPGESVAGFVNIETFSPFEREGFGLSLEAGTGEQELGGGEVQKLNGRVSWSNDRFGAVAFASNNKRRQVTDNREYDLGTDPATGEIIVNELDFRSYFVERQDNAWGGRVELRPGGVVDRVFANTLYTEFVDEEERNQYVFDFAGGAAAARGSVAPGETGYQPLVFVSRLLEDGTYENSTWTSTLGADFALTDWTVETRLNYTETSSNYFLPIPYSIVGQVAASYDVSTITDPQVTVFEPFTQTPRSINGLSYARTLALIVGGSLDNEAIKFKVDASREDQLFGRDVTVKVGAQYDTREASGYGLVQSVGGFPSSVDINAFETGTPWYTDFSNTIGATYFDNAGLRAAWAEAVGGFDVTPPDDQIIDIEEDILSTYAMATVPFEGGNAVFGVRVETTDFTTTGPAIPGGYSDQYANVLPNAHLNFDVSEDMKLRFSFSTGISRPTYTEARAGATVDPTNRSVSGGNPTLSAEEAWGGDVSWEWYFAPASILSLGAFYREVDNVIYADTTSVDGGLYLPSAAGERWTLTGYVNGDKGFLRGIEVNAIFQLGDASELLEGFGASANLTLLESEFETNSGAKFSLPGTSDNILNASVFYEKFGLSARLNYQYRDAWLSTTENDSLGEYWDAQQRVDASLRYALPYEIGGSQVTLFANGNNLTDEKDTRYVGTPRTPNQYEGYGRYWLVGLRLDY